MNFDLHEVIQMTETQITFSLLDQNYNSYYYNQHDVTIPHFVVLEGKRDYPFNDSTKESDDPISESDVPDWAVVLPRIEDEKDLNNNLVTFGRSHNVNVKFACGDDNQSSYSSNLRDVGLKECRYFKIKMLYQDDKRSSDKVNQNRGHQPSYGRGGRGGRRG